MVGIVWTEYQVLPARLHEVAVSRQPALATDLPRTAEETKRDEKPEYRGRRPDGFQQIDSINIHVEL